MKKTAGAETYFAYDEAGRLIGEYDTTGAPIQELVWLADTPVASVRPVAPSGFAVFYIWADHLNTPRVVSDAANQVRWEWANANPFGAHLPNENPGGAGAFNFNLRFPGQYYGGETGLHYNYFRDYDPGIGRYVQSDPIGLKGGTEYLRLCEVAVCCSTSILKAYACKCAVGRRKIAKGLIDHCWVTTDTKSAGMGANPNVAPGQEYEGWGMSVQINDHSKDKPSQCTTMNNVDEQCVNNELTIGKGIGRFIPPFNHCQSFAYGVVNKCRSGNQLK